MAERALQQTFTLQVWNTSTNAPQASDAANLTLKVVKDAGSATATTNSPVDLEQGVVRITLTAAECTCDTATILGSSSTANVVVLPISIDFRSTADVDKVSGDANAAINLEADYDGTGYNKANSTVAFSTNVTNQVTADVTAISGDAAAADNLEATYDGTGYEDDVAPAQQGQLSNIVSTGSALNTPADGFTLNTGASEVNTFANTYARDGQYHSYNDSAGVLDAEYTFDLATDSIPTGITFFGRLNGGNDEVLIQGYDNVAAAWITLTTVPGINGSGDSEFQAAMFGDMVDGAGQVRVRFYQSAGLTSATLYVDQIYISYAVVARTVGYSNASVWVDTALTNTSTQSYIDGTADNKVSTLSAANTLKTNIGLNRITFSEDDTVTLVGSQAQDEFYGSGYTVNLGNQTIPSYISGAYLQGATNGTTGTAAFEKCQLGTGSLLTLNDDVNVTQSNIVNVLLEGTGREMFGLSAVGGAAGSIQSGGILDFKNAVTSHNVSLAKFSGTLTIKNMQAGDFLSVSGTGQIILDSTNTGGTFIPAGVINIIDTSATVNVVTEGLLTTHSISSGVWDDITADHITPGTFGGELSQFDHTTDEALADLVKVSGSTAAADRLELSAGQIIPATASAGGTTTTIPSNLVESTDDHYNGRIIVFTTGVLTGQATSITDYVGSTKTLTVVAMTEAPGDGDTFIIV